eukprot:CAMPEP_0119110262 /NCGR_PEP_ID=MMETSP1180-20130426/28249_1 /TAXON_ID=3052 ORGANISM="Chlamydomonas cf sp, Strain CCMP681" /NCGR_SAMPLE_ID=MMETSP1180 /ASSEMBLY_ACC=CAM_ASM_000741 /LENGTH=394 /DNA_ID=CAMNT_0007096493 /DNA_START=36 /DNA_END=1220 /DNA_ORIENTATION=+
MAPKKVKAATQAQEAEGSPAAPIAKATRRRKAPEPEADGTEAVGAVATSAKKPRAPRKKKVAEEVEPAAASTEAAKQGEKDEAASSPDSAKPAPKKKAAARKPKVPQWPVYTEAMRPAPLEGPTTKLLCWNVAGLRGAMKKEPEFLAKLIAREAPDIICLQEIKISVKHIEEVQAQLKLPPGWHANWNCSEDKAGYSGVATLSRVSPLSVSKGVDMPEHDGEGRILVTTFPTFTLVNCYSPNSGEGLKRMDYRVKEGGFDASLGALIKRLQKTKPVVLTGDLNCAHHEIDLYHPKTNLRSAGFTQEERDSFSANFIEGCGLVDTFRAQYPETRAYTYFSYRGGARPKGVGWRIDYFLTDASLHPRVHDAWILADYMGSDHVPLGVTLKGALDSA